MSAVSKGDSAPLDPSALYQAPTNGLLPVSEPTLPTTPENSIPTTQEEPQELEATEADSFEVEDLVEEAKGKEPPSLQESYKQLKTTYKELSKSAREKESEFETIKKKLENYENGTAVSPVLEQKEKTIQELQAFRDSIEFKSSPEYEEKLAKPIAEAKGKLKSLTDSYGFPLETLLEERKGSTEAEFNQLLSEHFDPVGALKVDGLLNNLYDLEAKASEAEKTPVKTMEAFKGELERANQVKNIERVGKIQTTAKKSWVSVLDKIRTEGKFPALIYSDVDTAHNAIVEQFITHAAQEFKKTVQSFAQAGLPELSEELAEVIIKGHLYSTTAAAMSTIATSAMQETEKLKTKTKDLFKVNRPSIGGGSPNTSVDGSRPIPVNPKAAAQEITKKILADRRS